MRSNFQIITNNLAAFSWRIGIRGFLNLVDIGTDLCLYPRKILRGSANKDEYSKIKILDLFSIIFDNKLWEILVTETNASHIGQCTKSVKDGKWTTLGNRIP